MSETWRQSDEAIRNLIAEEIWRYQECTDNYGPFNQVSVEVGDMKALAKSMALDEAEGIRKVILESPVLRARLNVPAQQKLEPDDLTDALLRVIDGWRKTHPDLSYYETVTVIEGIGRLLHNLRNAAFPSTERGAG